MPFEREMCCDIVNDNLQLCYDNLLLQVSDGSVIRVEKLVFMNHQFDKSHTEVSYIAVSPTKSLLC